MARINLWALLCVLAVSSALSVLPTSDAAPLPSPPEKAAPVPSPHKGAVDCSTVTYNMMDCVDYVSAGSNTSKPDESCCEGIKSVVHLSPSCLCEALQEAASMKIDLNLTRVAALPTICKFTAPSLDSCTMAGSPGPAPAPPSKSKSPPPSHPPALPVPAPSSPVVPSPPAELPTPSSTPVVPSPPAEPPTKTTHNALAAPAPLPSGASSLPFNAINVLAVCLLATTISCLS